MCDLLFSNFPLIPKYEQPLAKLLEVWSFPACSAALVLNGQPKLELTIFNPFLCLRFNSSSVIYCKISWLYGGEV